MEPSRKDEAIATTTRDMFAKVSDYVKGEVYGERKRPGCVRAWWGGARRYESCLACTYSALCKNVKGRMAVLYAPCFWSPDLPLCRHTASSEDYQLLEKLHLVTADRFDELTKNATEIRDSMSHLQVRFFMLTSSFVEMF